MEENPELAKRFQTELGLVKSEKEADFDFIQNLHDYTD
jgi:hypothetical protein